MIIDQKLLVWGMGFVIMIMIMSFIVFKYMYQNEKLLKENKALREQLQKENDYEYKGEISTIQVIQEQEEPSKELWDYTCE